MIESITTFESVDLSNSHSTQPIVVCDIDNTILYIPVFKTYAYFYKLVKTMFPNKSLDLLYAEASHLFNENKKAVYEDKPVVTDYLGFQRLLNRVREMDGKIIYLTARSGYSSQITKKQFEENGLIYDESNTYYTNNMIHKGDFLEKMLKIDKNTPIIFIDDLDDNLNNVSYKYPNSKCYKFIYDNPPIK
jgi:hypothetical protein